jgi:hypothetical protein
MDYRSTAWSTRGQKTALTKRDPSRFATSRLSGLLHIWTQHPLGTASRIDKLDVVAAFRDYTAIGRH